MSQTQKLYGDVYLDSHKSYALVGTDGDGKVFDNKGIDTTFVDGEGNTITVVGGIITAKEAP
jgi:hypothetical protein